MNPYTLNEHKTKNCLNKIYNFKRNPVDVSVNP